MTSSSHRVQGLNNDEVAADWPPISAADIAWLSTRYPQLGGHSQPRWHSPRPLSAAAIVDGTRGAVFIKRHHHSVRSDLSGRRTPLHRPSRRRGVPVVQVLPATDGHTAVEHGEWTFELHDVGVGDDLYRDAVSWSLLTDVAQAREAGRTLTLHRAAASYHAPSAAPICWWRATTIRADDPIAAIKAGLDERPGLARYLARIPWEAQLQRDVLPWHAGLAERLRAEPRLWAHNDWHVSNLLWRNGEVSTVLDFGLASPTSALFDLATAIERNAVAWLELERGMEAVRIDIALALLDGYREVLPLSAARTCWPTCCQWSISTSHCPKWSTSKVSPAQPRMPTWPGSPSCWAIRRGSTARRDGHCCRPCTPSRDPVDAALRSDPFPQERDLTGSQIRTICSEMVT